MSSAWQRAGFSADTLTLVDQLTEGADVRGTTPTPWARAAPAPADRITVTVSVPWPTAPCCPPVTCPPLRPVLHIGAPRETDEQDRTPGKPGVPTTEEWDTIMDLQADKQVTATLGAKDEVGNTVPLPEGTTVEWDVDNDAVIALTDNGDGSANIAATGLLGVALVTATATREDGSTASGVLAVNVVAGDAETFAITTGEPTEVTPDGETEPPVEPVI